MNGEENLFMYWWKCYLFICDKRGGSNELIVRLYVIGIGKCVSGFSVVLFVWLFGC